MSRSKEIFPRLFSTTIKKFISKEGVAVNTAVNHERADTLGPTGVTACALPTLSTRLWGVDWSTCLPIFSADQSQWVEHTHYENVAHFLTTPETDPLFHIRSIFYGDVCDAFAFYRRNEHGDRVLFGAMIANPSDPTTYYLRYVFLQPQFRGSGIYGKLIETITRKLSSVPSIERIDLDVVPDDPANPTRYAHFGYRVTGHYLSDKLGGLIRMTAHLKQEHLESFRIRYCPPTALTAHHQGERS